MVKSGKLPMAEARQRAAEAIRPLRYGSNDYIFIEDMQTRMVLHPFRPDLEGKEVGGFKDPNGLPLFVAFVDAVKRDGAGVVDYLWPRPGSAAPVEKLSYVQGFAPWGWVIGTGIYVDDLRAEQTAVLLHRGLAAGVMALLAGILSWAIARGIARPLAAVTAATLEIAQGGLDAAIPGTERGDELGVLAGALERLRADAVKKRELEHLAETEQAAKDRRHAAMERYTDDFATSVAGVMAGLTESAGSMRRTAGVVADGADETTRAMRETVGGATVVAHSLSTVAAATEELAASVAEISRQVAQASIATGEAVQRTTTTRDHIAGLSGASQEITEVVRLISYIAGKTNLLALNATIEAVRAGDAGKGFAVVASEVKQLAQQTAKATDQIERQVRSIHAATAEAVSAVAAVGESVQGVNVISTAIAAAVEQQGAATSEIAQQVQSVAVENSAATDRLIGVERVAETTQGASRNVLNDSGELAEVSATLRREVDHFLAAMRCSQHDRRRYERVAVAGRSVTVQIDGMNYPADVVDISQGGIRLRIAAPASTCPGKALRVECAALVAGLDGRIARLEQDTMGVLFSAGPRNLENIRRLLDAWAPSTQKAA